jgi:hypothetical protein
MLTSYRHKTYNGIVETTLGEWVGDNQMGLCKASEGICNTLRGFLPAFSGNPFA